MQSVANNAERHELRTPYLFQTFLRQGSAASPYFLHPLSRIRKYLCLTPSVLFPSLVHRWVSQNCDCSFPPLRPIMVLFHHLGLDLFPGDDACWSGPFHFLAYPCLFLWRQCPYFSPSTCMPRRLRFEPFPAVTIFWHESHKGVQSRSLTPSFRSGSRVSNVLWSMLVRS